MERVEARGIHAFEQRNPEKKKWRELILFCFFFHLASSLWAWVIVQDWMGGGGSAGGETARGEFAGGEFAGGETAGDISRR
mmetsp:Transcript_2465/g.9052  ORF Transcript_2465/g.9052 Transcript_2465/m.9052 type:complete len:81 (-) Transcript_2465:32-274(-)